MGVDTRLYVSMRFSVEDIGDVITSHVGGTDIKITGTHTPDMSIIAFRLDNDSRVMYAHRSELPTGPCLLLSLGHNEQAINIMRTIGKAIGGILEESDCEGKMESIDGHLSDNDGLQYFLKWATIHNKIPNHSMKEFNAAIKDWHKNITESDSRKYDLF